MDSQLVENLELITGLWMKRYANEIREYTFLNVTRKTLDLWFESVKSYMLTYPDGSISYGLHDFTKANISTIPPYMRGLIQRLAAEVGQQTPRSTAYIAIIVPKTATMMIARMFLMTIQSLNKSTYMMFFSRDEGMTWLTRELANRGYTVHASPPSST